MIPAIHHIVDKLSQNSLVDSIILFGSRARGDHWERSDIDLAVVCPAASIKDWFMMTDIIDDAPTLLKIDLVRYAEMPEAFREEIDREGITLYERESKDQTIHA